jgi:hypothetical protein
VKSWWRAVLTYPPTWVAAALLVVGLWLIVSWVEPSGALLIVLIVLAILAVITWPFTMSASGRLRELQFAIPRIEDVDPREIASLAAELETLDDTQPAEQLRALQQKRATLVDVLERRLDGGEITYSRYLAAAELVFQSALHNLREVAVANKSISTIDEGYIDRRLGELATDDSDAESSARERATLEQRRQLRVGQRSKIAKLMAQNESGLTALDRTTTALADVPIGKRPEDAEAAMSALEELAERASLYAS